MKEEEWNQLLQRGNGQFFQMVSCFRKSPGGEVVPRPRKDLLRTVAESLGAMANAGGGTVLLGIDTAEETLGVPFSEAERQLFQGLLRGAFEPSLDFQIASEELLGKTLLCFRVPASPVVHFLKNGKCFLRVAFQNVPLSPEKAAALRENRAETRHEREILPYSSPDDLDSILVDEFISRAGLSGKAEEILHRPYGLIEYGNGKPLLTRAAAYLFGRDPLRWHPRPGIEFVRFEGTEGRRGEGYNVVERVRLEAPLLKLIREVEGLLGERVKERILQRDLFFREKLEYPAFIWKEALVNALAHRDYSLEGSAVSVWMFDDRLEVRSPGRLPQPVRAEQIQRRQRIHYSRNPLISRVLTDAGYMRSLGEGTLRMFQEMERHGLNPPEWREEGDFCCLVLRNTPVLDDSTLEWLKQFSPYPLSPRQKRILTYARVHGGIFSSSDYQKFGVDRDGAYVEIKALVRQGLVEPLKKHGKVYRVREIREEGASLPGLTWVMEFLKEKGYFTFRELKVPPSLSREKARALIRDWVDQGYLTPSGKGKATRFQMTEKLRPLLEKKNPAGIASPVSSEGGWKFEE
jgi:ATP-dependent DNA helicase RecG